MANSPLEVAYIGFGLGGRAEAGAVGDVPPVFDSLARAGVSGRALARLLSVSPPTISKWRRGKARADGVKVAFLTLFVSNWLDDAQENDGVLGVPRPPVGEPSAGLGLRAALRRQDEWNQRLSVEAVREGSRLFRAWYEGSKGRVIRPGSSLPIEFK